MKRPRKTPPRAELEYDDYADLLVQEGISDPVVFAREVYRDRAEATPSLVASLWNTAMLLGGAALQPVSKEQWAEIISSSTTQEAGLVVEQDEAAATSVAQQPGEPQGAFGGATTALGMRAYMVTTVNNKCIATGLWPNGSKATREDIDRLKAENEAAAEVMKAEGVVPPINTFASTQELDFFGGASSEIPALPNKAVASALLANAVRQALESGQTLSSRDLYDAGDKAFGGSQAAGVYSAKDAYDAMELGVNLFIAANPERFNPLTNTLDAQATSQALQELLQQLPTQRVRTAESEEYQQFSTPPHLAYAVAWVAALRPTDVVLEPSAGLGGLAVWGRNAGVSEIVVNELSNRRRALVANMAFDQVFSEDAEHLHAVLPESVTPSVILMNPPFSSSAGKRQGERDTMNGARHIEQALERLQDGGRLVAIVGEGMALERPAFRAWWAKIQSEYTLRANIGIDGRTYAKYGTTFDNQILVIDKTGPTTVAPVSGKVASVNELFPLLESIQNERANTASSTSTASLQSSDSGSLGSLEAGDNARMDADSATRPVGSTEPRGAVHLSDPRASGSDVGELAPIASGSAAARGGERKTRRPRGDGTSRGGSLFNVGSDSAPGVVVIADSDVAMLEPVSDVASRLVTDAIFTDYSPQKVFVSGAQPHPTKLVESSAMAAVSLPDPTYQPRIPRKLLESGTLSLPQYEATVYAGMAHNQLGPDGTRLGFFIGDGTGVGKTRELASILIDNFAQGRNRAVWISAKRGLLKAIQSDLQEMGAGNIPLHDLGKTKSKFGKVELPAGVVFSTFDTLRGDLSLGGVPSEFAPGATVVLKATGVEGRVIRSRALSGALEVTFTSGDGAVEITEPSTSFTPVTPANRESLVRSRVDQIVEWFGPTYDGLIFLDEAHKAGNAVEIKGQGIRGSKKPSQQALAVLELQERLPNARVVYASATGATEVSNLAYADRLGIWGNGTAFPNREAFISHISSAGLSAMEIVARDLKALGKYQARTLSWEGVEFDALEHSLTPEQVKMYDQIAHAWQIVFANMNEVLEATGANNSPAAHMSARSAFFSSQQRFFNQLLTSLQMPTMLADIRENIAQGNAVLVQITNTNEATQTRQLAKAADEERPLEDIDLSPKDILLQYLDSAFPTKLFQQISDGNSTRWVLVSDSNGNPVDDPRAVKTKHELMDRVASLSIPQNPLEQLLEEFGPDAVAEMTGRTQRVVWKEVDGVRKKVVEARSDATRQMEAQEFNDDKRKVLIFSEAGGTGYSYHADRRFLNQRRRIHYLAQAGWTAATAVQGLGRGHRSNQTVAPFIKLVRTDIEGHKRFISTIARRLAQLGALTSGERRATGQGLFGEHDNLENKYASQALERMVSASFQGQLQDVPWELLSDKMGFDNLVNAATGQLLFEKVNVPQFLNRLLTLEITDQNKVFSAFHGRMVRLIEDAKAAGHYDSGLQQLHVNKGGWVTLISDDIAYQREGIDQPTRLLHLEITEPAELLDFEDAERRLELGSFWAKNNRSGKVYLMNPSDHTETDRSTGVVHTTLRRIGVKSAEWVKEEDVNLNPPHVYANVGDILPSGETITALPEVDRLLSRVMVRDASGQERPYSNGHTSPADAVKLYEDHGLVIRGVNDGHGGNPMRAWYVKKAGNYTKLTLQEAKAAWDAEKAATDPYERRRVTLLTGLLLPVWDRLRLSHPRVYRTTLDTGDAILGVMIPSDALQGVRERLGVAGQQLSPEEVVASVLTAGHRHELANGWAISRCRIAGEYRIEVTGVPPESQDEFETYIGGFTERREWRTRYFIPTQFEQSIEVLERLLAKAPLIQKAVSDNAADRLGEELAGPLEQVLSGAPAAYASAHAPGASYLAR